MEERMNVEYALLGWFALISALIYYVDWRIKNKLMGEKIEYKIRWENERTRRIC